MFPIITLIIMPYQAASFYRLAHIRPRSLRETASLIPIFKGGYFTKTTPGARREIKTLKMSKESCLSVLFYLL